MPAGRGPSTVITPKAAPDGQGAAAAEQLADFRRRGVGGHVVVLGRAAQQLIADAAAGPIGLETRRAQPANHFQGKVTLLLRIDHGRNKIVTQIAVRMVMHRLRALFKT